MKTKVVTLLVILLSAVAVLFFFLSSGQKGAGPRHKAIVDLDAPEFTVTDASGKTLSLAELKGTVVFVNFWATWCQTCQEEMPSIQRLYSRFKDDKGFRMVTILFRDDYAKAMAYLEGNNYGFSVWMDSKEKAAKAYGLTGVPETYIVSKKGILKQKVIGPTDWDSPQAISLISNLIRE